ncbi:hypothetical protein L7F22_015375 [Adiantum nelumboides]|nr:hypothetical protein [Adiantum nelumboides]
MANADNQRLAAHLQDAKSVVNTLNKQITAMASKLDSLREMSRTPACSSVVDTTQNISSLLIDLLTINELCTKRLNQAFRKIYYGILNGHTGHVQQLKKAVKKAKHENIRLTAEVESLKDSASGKLIVCKICYDKPRNVVIVPCLHGHFCADCLEKHRKKHKNAKCPTCRSVINGMFSYIA